MRNADARCACAAVPSIPRSASDSFTVNHVSWLTSLGDEQPWCLRVPLFTEVRNITARNYVSSHIIPISSDFGTRVSCFGLDLGLLVVSY